MAEFINEKYFDNYEVLTPNGWKSFSGVGKTIEYNEYKVILEDNYEIICADDHLFVVGNKSIFCSELEIGNFLDTNDGLKKIVNIEKLNTKSNMYDLLNVDGEIYYTNNIVSHNSTTVGAYVLWYALFHEDIDIGLVSNNAAGAREILHRIKAMYEELPSFLKPGVLEWNKTSIQFSNNTRIITGATKSDSLRGKTIKFLVCVSERNKVKIRNKETGKIEELTMKQLTERLQYEGIN